MLSSNIAFMYPMIEMAGKHITYIDQELIKDEFQSFSYDDKEFDEVCAAQAYVSLKQPLKSRGEELVDLTVFSFDRPIQLYAFLESVERFITGLGEVSVVYRTSSSKEIKKAYKKVKKRFNSVNFIKQSSKNPRYDFKEKTLGATFNSPNSYIAFAVDDIIVKDPINLAECVAMLKTTQTHGFFLRMGKNITHCYMMDCAEAVPNLVSVGRNIYAWNFKGSSYDWACPNTVDMTVYCKEQIKELLCRIDFDTPNFLEGAWCNVGGPQDMEKMGLCYENSKIVNLPLNQVQRSSGIIRNMNISTKDLLAKFNKGYKIDINPLHTMGINSPHMEYVPTYIKRK